MTGYHNICASLNEQFYRLFLYSYSKPRINFIHQSDAVWLCCVASCYMLNFQLFLQPQPVPHWEHSDFWTVSLASAHILRRTWQCSNHGNWVVTHSHHGYDLYLGYYMLGYSVLAQTLLSTWNVFHERKVLSFVLIILHITVEVSDWQCILYLSVTE